MGTISDKLMRIINTKEDIRQALISKGYDVPTSIPFKEYAKMILDLPCKVDSFPDIEGIVARYSASGLTNEYMAANPVWVDKTGNGHDLQLKNFAWKGMSGVGGYGDENHLTFYKFTLDDYVFIATPPGVKHMNFTFRVTGLQPGNKLTLAFFGTTNTVYGTWNKDGIYTVDADIVEAGKPTYFYNGYGATRGEFTIEILPLYPGALVFDGVDDWAGCDNLPLLPKEKGYSIIALRNWITRYDATQYKRPLISNLDTNDEGAFLIEYRKDENVNDVTGSYNSFTDVYIDDNNPITWQTSSSYNGQIIKKGTSKSTNKLSICKTYFGQLSNYANAAIWEIVILDHDATEEELTKIKDYFIKTYPWLFPDQAWTVTGKTNEDEDRATITNITGNGNDLVLSNFGFIEGSGYNEEGEYAGYLVTDGVDDKIASSDFKIDKDFTIVGDWKFIIDENKGCGLVKIPKLFIYNSKTGLDIYINSNSIKNILSGIKVLNAVCSDGRVYDCNWNEISVKYGNMVDINSSFLIANSGNIFTKMAFKNLGIYNNQLLSKDDCIKAYNYLQTLKSK